MGGFCSAVNEDMKSEAKRELRKSEHQKVTDTFMRALLQIQKNTVPLLIWVTRISLH
jgi:hypothetical protein